MIKIKPTIDDVISWLEGPPAIMAGSRGRMTSATIAHLRRLQAFDAAIADAFPPQRIEWPSDDQARTPAKTESGDPR